MFEHFASTVQLIYHAVSLWYSTEKVVSLVDPYAASTSCFVRRCCTQFSIKRCLQLAHACRPPLRTCVVAHRAPQMAPYPRRVPLAMRARASRRPHGDRPVALRSPAKDRTATARHGNALHPPVGAHGWARRPRVPLELYRRERQRTEASTSGGGVIASPWERLETLKLNPSKNRVSEFFRRAWRNLSEKTKTMFKVPYATY